MRLSDNKAIHITILDDRHAGECAAGCNTDWSKPESLELARRQTAGKFGKRVGIDYINISAAANADTQKWRRLIKERKLLLPLLLLNGEIRISGPFDLRQLLDIIEAETEIEVEV